MTKTIYRTVEYDPSGGFYYQLTAEDQRQGPFENRASAIADAAWRMSHCGVCGATLFTPTYTRKGRAVCSQACAAA